MKSQAFKAMNRAMIAVAVGLVANIALADDDTLRDLGTNAVENEIPKWDGSKWRNAHDDITTVVAGNGLEVGMTNKQATISVKFATPGTNNLVARYEDVVQQGIQMDATRPPVGSIVAWAKNLTGVSTNLPAGWVPCDGQTLNDTNSPLHGTVIPNLNGAASQARRFLRGASVSGSVGGSETHTHTTQGGAEGGGGYNFNPGGYSHYHYVNEGSSLPPFYEIVWIMRIK